MKKILLSLATVAMAAAPVLADTVTFDFKTNVYGIEGQTAGVNTNTAFFTNGTMTNGDVKISVASGSGSGFRFWTDGLRVYKNKSDLNTLSISDTDDNITEIVLEVYKSYSKVEVDGTELSYVSSSKSYTWSGSKETPVLGINTANNSAIVSITVTYEAAGQPGLLPAEVKFAEANMQAIMGLPFEGQTATKASDGALTYASSDAAVATVDAQTGAVTLVAPGTTTITASVPATATYNEGSASYTLTVVKGYESFAEFNTLAKGDKGIIAFPSTVAFQNGQYLYLYDAENNFALIFGNGQPTYTVGDVVPGNWEGELDIYNGLYEIKPAGTLPAADGHNDFTPATVTELSEAIVNHVVVLEGVEFTEATLNATSGNTASRTFTGKIGETEISFYSRFTDVEVVDPGKYDVLGAVSTYNGNLQVYPISYAEHIDTGIDAIDAENGAAVYYNLQGVRVANPENGMFVRVQNGKAQKVVVK